MNDMVFQGLQLLLQNLWVVPLGVLIGMVVGATPGLTSSNSLAILLPILILVPPDIGLVLGISLYAGAEMGNSFPAVMLNIPGTPAATVTCLEGYPLRMRGLAARAFGICIMASTLGALVGGAASITMAPLLANVALKFSAVEICIVIIFGLAVIAQVSAGSLIKGLLAGFAGLLIATTGTDPVFGQFRGTFGVKYLIDGYALIASLIGLLGFSELLFMIEDSIGRSPRQISAGTIKFSDIKEGFWIVLRKPVEWIRSSVIGIVVGVIPGAGASAAAFVAYQQSMVFASPEVRKWFGKGSYDGLIASDASNNSVVGGSLVPLLTLGIPGSTSMAVLLVVMEMHDMVLGPRLFAMNGDVAYSVLWSQFAAGAFILVIGTGLAWVAHRIASVPTNVIVPIIAVFCLIGGFARNEHVFEMGIMVGFGILGYFMKKHEYSPIAFLLGMILGPLFEANLFRGLKLGFGSPEKFFTRPLALMLWGLLVIAFVGPPLFRALAAKRKAAGN